jgi:calcineurin-like phosphoesterase family protein
VVLVATLAPSVSVTTMKFTKTESERTWFISDPHFDHANIIKYCHRPFRSVRQMNAAIRWNWNSIIHPNDLVYFVGDMSFGMSSRSPRWWLKRLNGKKIYIKGSHDRGIRLSSIIPGVSRVSEFEYVTVDGMDFLVVHDPFSAVVKDWDGWIIHGHHHNTKPFCDFQEKRINVSVEAIDYKPISLARIIDTVLSG